MKREILCPGCARKMRALFPTEQPYPGESVKFVEGESLQSCVCDHCNGSVFPGSPCVAFSIYTSDRPYSAWESEYLKPLQTGGVS